MCWGCTKRDYLTDFTLQELEKRLPTERFERVHRRALLNLDHVLRLGPVETGGYFARLSRGQTLDVFAPSGPHSAPPIWLA